VKLQPAVFLDRDGTLIEEKEYLSDPNGVVMVPGTFEALRELRAAGFGLVIVTNQSGIARGYYTEDDYHAVAARVNALLDEAGAPIDDTRFCPHHPDVTGPCACRKPATGMYLAAAADLGLDLRASYYIGDKLTDVLPALELAGQGILVRTGYGRDHEASVPEGTWVVDDVRSAVGRIRFDSGR
jgi:D-glycero-D-manno-heptose 1,7-bisphosphate phosphatase